MRVYIIIHVARVGACGYMWHCACRYRGKQEVRERSRGARIVTERSNVILRSDFLSAAKRAVILSSDLRLFITMTSQTYVV